VTILSFTCDVQNMTVPLTFLVDVITLLQENSSLPFPVTARSGFQQQELYPPGSDNSEFLSNQTSEMWPVSTDILPFRKPNSTLTAVITPEIVPGVDNAFTIGSVVNMTHSFWFREAETTACTAGMGVTSAQRLQFGAVVNSTIAVVPGPLLFDGAPASPWHRWELPGTGDAGFSFVADAVTLDRDAGDQNLLFQTQWAADDFGVAINGGNMDLVARIQCDQVTVLETQRFTNLLAYEPLVTLLRVAPAGTEVPGVAGFSSQLFLTATASAAAGRSTAFNGTFLDTTLDEHTYSIQRVAVGGNVTFNASAQLGAGGNRLGGSGPGGAYQPFFVSDLPTLLPGETVDLEYEVHINITTEVNTLINAQLRVDYSSLPYQVPPATWPRQYQAPRVVPLRVVPPVMSISVENSISDTPLVAQIGELLFLRASIPLVPGLMRAAQLLGYSVVPGQVQALSLQNVTVANASNFGSSLGPLEPDVVDNFVLDPLAVQWLVWDLGDVQIRGNLSSASKIEFDVLLRVVDLPDFAPGAAIALSGALVTSFVGLGVVGETVTLELHQPELAVAVTSATGVGLAQAGDLLQLEVQVSNPPSQTDGFAWFVRLLDFTSVSGLYRVTEVQVGGTVVYQSDASNTTDGFVNLGSGPFGSNWTVAELPDADAGDSVTVLYTVQLKADIELASAYSIDLQLQWATHPNATAARHLSASVSQAFTTAHPTVSWGAVQGDETRTAAGLHVVAAALVVNVTIEVPPGLLTAAELLLSQSGAALYFVNASAVYPEDNLTVADGSSWQTRLTAPAMVASGPEGIQIQLGDVWNSDWRATGSSRRVTFSLLCYVQDSTAVAFGANTDTLTAQVNNTVGIVPAVTSALNIGMAQPVLSVAQAVKTAATVVQAHDSIVYAVQVSASGCAACSTAYAVRLLDTAASTQAYAIQQISVGGTVVWLRQDYGVSGEVAVSAGPGGSFDPAQMANISSLAAGSVWDVEITVTVTTAAETWSLLQPVFQAQWLSHPAPRFVPARAADDDEAAPTQRVQRIAISGSWAVDNATLDASAATIASRVRYTARVEVPQGTATTLLATLRLSPVSARYQELTPFLESAVADAGIRAAPGLSAWTASHATPLVSIGTSGRGGYHITLGNVVNVANDTDAEFITLVFSYRVTSVPVHGLTVASSVEVTSVNVVASATLITLPLLRLREPSLACTVAAPASITLDAFTNSTFTFTNTLAVGRSPAYCLQHRDNTVASKPFRIMQVSVDGSAIFTSTAVGQGFPASNTGPGGADAGLLAAPACHVAITTARTLQVIYQLQTAAEMGTSYTIPLQTRYKSHYAGVATAADARSYSATCAVATVVVPQPTITTSYTTENSTSAGLCVPGEIVSISTEITWPEGSASSASLVLDTSVSSCTTACVGFLYISSSSSADAVLSSTVNAAWSALAGVEGVKVDGLPRVTHNLGKVTNSGADDSQDDKALFQYQVACSGAAAATGSTFSWLSSLTASTVSRTATSSIVLAEPAITLTLLTPDFFSVDAFDQLNVTYRVDVASGAARSSVHSLEFQDLALATDLYRVYAVYWDDKELYSVIPDDDTVGRPIRGTGPAGARDVFGLLPTPLGPFAAGDSHELTFSIMPRIEMQLLQRQAFDVRATYRSHSFSGQVGRPAAALAKNYTTLVDRNAEILFDGVAVAAITSPAYLPVGKQVDFNVSLRIPEGYLPYALITFNVSEADSMQIASLVSLRGSPDKFVNSTLGEWGSPSVPAQDRFLPGDVQLSLGNVSNFNTINAQLEWIFMTFSAHMSDASSNVRGDSSLLTVDMFTGRPSRRSIVPIGVSRQVITQEPMASVACVVCGQPAAVDASDFVVVSYQVQMANAAADQSSGFNVSLVDLAAWSNKYRVVNVTLDGTLLWERSAGVAASGNLTLGTDVPGKYGEPDALASWPVQSPGQSMLVELCLQLSADLLIGENVDLRAAVVVWSDGISPFARRYSTAATNDASFSTAFGAPVRTFTVDRVAGDATLDGDVTLVHAVEWLCTVDLPEGRLDSLQVSLGSSASQFTLLHAELSSPSGDVSFPAASLPSINAAANVGLGSGTATASLGNVVNANDDNMVTERLLFRVSGNVSDALSNTAGDIGSSTCTFTIGGISTTATGSHRTMEPSLAFSSTAVGTITDIQAFDNITVELVTSNAAGISRSSAFDILLSSPVFGSGLLRLLEVSRDGSLQWSATSSTDGLAVQATGPGGAAFPGLIAAQQLLSPGGSSTVSAVFQVQLPAAAAALNIFTSSVQGLSLPRGYLSRAYPLSDTAQFSNKAHLLAITTSIASASHGEPIQVCMLLTVPQGTQPSSILQLGLTTPTLVLGAFPTSQPPTSTVPTAVTVPWQNSSVADAVNTSTWSIALGTVVNTDRDSSVPEVVSFCVLAAVDQSLLLAPGNLLGLSSSFSSVSDSASATAVNVVVTEPFDVAVSFAAASAVVDAWDELTFRGQIVAGTATFSSAVYDAALHMPNLCNGVSLVVVASVHAWVDSGVPSAVPLASWCAAHATSTPTSPLHLGVRQLDPGSTLHFEVLVRVRPLVQAGQAFGFGAQAEWYGFPPAEVLSSTAPKLHSGVAAEQIQLRVEHLLPSAPVPRFFSPDTGAPLALLAPGSHFEMVFPLLVPEGAHEDVRLQLNTSLAACIRLDPSSAVIAGSSSITGSAPSLVHATPPPLPGHLQVYLQWLNNTAQNGDAQMYNVTVQARVEVGPQCARGDSGQPRLSASSAAQAQIETAVSFAALSIAEPDLFVQVSKLTASATADALDFVSYRIRLTTLSTFTHGRAFNVSVFDLGLELSEYSLYDAQVESQPSNDCVAQHDPAGFFVFACLQISPGASVAVNYTVQASASLPSGAQLKPNITAIWQSTPGVQGLSFREYQAINQTNDAVLTPFPIVSLDTASGVGALSTGTITLGEPFLLQLDLLVYEGLAPQVTLVLNSTDACCVAFTLAGTVFPARVLSSMTPAVAPGTASSFLIDLGDVVNSRTNEPSSSIELELQGVLPASEVIVSGDTITWNVFAFVDGTHVSSSSASQTAVEPVVTAAHAVQGGLEVQGAEQKTVQVTVAASVALHASDVHDVRLSWPVTTAYRVTGVAAGGSWAASVTGVTACDAPQEAVTYSSLSDLDLVPAGSSTVFQLTLVFCPALQANTSAPIPLSASYSSAAASHTSRRGYTAQSPEGTITTPSPTLTSSFALHVGAADGVFTAGEGVRVSVQLSLPVLSFPSLTVRLLVDTPTTAALLSAQRTNAAQLGSVVASAATTLVAAAVLLHPQSANISSGYVVSTSTAPTMPSSAEFEFDIQLDRACVAGAAVSWRTLLCVDGLLCIPHTGPSAQSLTCAEPLGGVATLSAASPGTLQGLELLRFALGLSIPSGALQANAQSVALQTVGADWQYMQLQAAQAGCSNPAPLVSPFTVLASGLPLATAYGLGSSFLAPFNNVSAGAADSMCLVLQTTNMLPIGAQLELDMTAHFTPVGLSTLPDVSKVNTYTAVAAPTVVFQATDFAVSVSAASNFVGIPSIRFVGGQPLVVQAVLSIPVGAAAGFTASLRMLGPGIVARVQEVSTATDHTVNINGSAWVTGSWSASGIRAVEACESSLLRPALPATQATFAFDVHTEWTGWEQGDIITAEFQVDCDSCAGSLATSAAVTFERSTVSAVDILPLAVTDIDAGDEFNITVSIQVSSTSAPVYNVQLLDASLLLSHYNVTGVWLGDSSLQVNSTHSFHGHIATIPSLNPSSTHIVTVQLLFLDQLEVGSTLPSAAQVRFDSFPGPGSQTAQIGASVQAVFAFADPVSTLSIACDVYSESSQRCSVGSAATVTIASSMPRGTVSNFNASMDLAGATGLKFQDLAQIDIDGLLASTCGSALSISSVPGGLESSTCSFTTEAASVSSSLRLVLQAVVSNHAAITNGTVLQLGALLLSSAFSTAVPAAAVVVLEPQLDADAVTGNFTDVQALQLMDHGTNLTNYNVWGSTAYNVSLQWQLSPSSTCPVSCGDAAASPALPNAVTVDGTSLAPPACIDDEYPLLVSRLSVDAAIHVLQSFIGSCALSPLQEATMAPVLQFSSHPHPLHARNYTLPLPLLHFKALDNAPQAVTVSPLALLPSLPGIYTPGALLQVDLPFHIAQGYTHGFEVNVTFPRAAVNISSAVWVHPSFLQLSVSGLGVVQSCHGSPGHCRVASPAQDISNSDVDVVSTEILLLRLNLTVLSFDSFAFNASSTWLPHAPASFAMGGSIQVSKPRVQGAIITNSENGAVGQEVLFVDVDLQHAGGSLVDAFHVQCLDLQWQTSAPLYHILNASLVMGNSTLQPASNSSFWFSVSHLQLGSVARVRTAIRVSATLQWGASFKPQLQCTLASHPLSEDASRGVFDVSSNFTVRALNSTAVAGSLVSWEHVPLLPGNAVTAGSQSMVWFNLTLPALSSPMLEAHLSIGQDAAHAIASVTAVSSTIQHPSFSVSCPALGQALLLGTTVKHDLCSLSGQHDQSGGIAVGVQLLYSIQWAPHLGADDLPTQHLRLSLLLARTASPSVDVNASTADVSFPVAAPNVYLGALSPAFYSGLYRWEQATFDLNVSTPATQHSCWFNASCNSSCVAPTASLISSPAFELRLFDSGLNQSVAPGQLYEVTRLLVDGTPASHDAAAFKNIGQLWYISELANDAVLHISFTVRLLLPSLWATTVAPSLTAQWQTLPQDRPFAKQLNSGACGAQGATIGIVSPTPSVTATPSVTPTPTTTPTPTPTPISAPFRQAEHQESYEVFHGANDAFLVPQHQLLFSDTASGPFAISTTRGACSVLELQEECGPWWDDVHLQLHDMATNDGIEHLSLSLYAPTGSPVTGSASSRNGMPAADLTMEVTVLVRGSSGEYNNATVRVLLLDHETNTVNALGATALRSFHGAVLPRRQRCLHVLGSQQGLVQTIVFRFEVHPAAQRSFSLQGAPSWANVEQVVIASTSSSQQWVSGSVQVQVAAAGVPAGTHVVQLTLRLVLGGVVSESALQLELQVLKSSLGSLPESGNLQLRPGSVTPYTLQVTNQGVLPSRVAVLFGSNGISPQPAWLNISLPRSTLLFPSSSLDVQLLVDASRVGQAGSRVEVTLYLQSSGLTMSEHIQVPLAVLVSGMLLCPASLTAVLVAGQRTAWNLQLSSSMRQQLNVTIVPQAPLHIVTSANVSFPPVASGTTERLHTLRVQMTADGAFSQVGKYALNVTLHAVMLIHGQIFTEMRVVQVQAQVTAGVVSPLHSKLHLVSVPGAASPALRRQALTQAAHAEVNQTAEWIVASDGTVQLPVASVEANAAVQYAVVRLHDAHGNAIISPPADLLLTAAAAQHPDQATAGQFQVMFLLEDSASLAAQLVPSRVGAMTVQAKVGGVDLLGSPALGVVTPAICAEEGYQLALSGLRCDCSPGFERGVLLENGAVASAEQCVPCPGAFAKGSASNTRRCQRCPDGQFASNNRTVCLPCPVAQRLQCAAGSWSLQAGAWCVGCTLQNAAVPAGRRAQSDGVVQKKSNSSFQEAILTSDAIVHSCFNVEACEVALGGQAMHCAEGYSGPLCAVCDEGYGRTSRFTCSRCPSQVVSFAAAALPLILMLCLVAAYAAQGPIPQETAARTLFLSALRMSITWSQATLVLFYLDIQPATYFKGWFITLLQSGAGLRPQLQPLDCHLGE